MAVDGELLNARDFIPFLNVALHAPRSTDKDKKKRQTT